MKQNLENMAHGFCAEGSHLADKQAVFENSKWFESSSCFYKQNVNPNYFSLSHVAANITLLTRRMVNCLIMLGLMKRFRTPFLKKLYGLPRSSKEPQGNTTGIMIIGEIKLILYYF
jgi:hypothetical protein